ncbi:hypothetical protein GCM10007425_12340 [Lysinibacillus alkalisoli]|uniref:DUF3037 domain-containing protein n=1 Tax=Lysinibacillus alkalisoli TaxID=1911548 RepID=A0A917G317_9BACI|nr:hypothetical protein [Lysinibacillus alkalisoli]GGG19386.1 hypothetical protein GCM10007425_12340 [Lysinibacillus alkalisoli]
MNNIYFSIAKYVPDNFRDEKIIFGFAYHYPKKGKLGFVHTTNTNRLKSFDDELELDEITFLKDSLKFDFSIDSLEVEDEFERIESLLKADSKDLLNYKIYNYVNSICFDHIDVLPNPKTDVPKDYLELVLEDLKDLYLYYDKPKNKRIDNKRVQRLTKQILRIKNREYKEAPKPKPLSFYLPPYDYVIEDNCVKHYIKSLSVEYKRPHDFYSNVRSIILYINYYNDSYREKIKKSNMYFVINNWDLTNEYESIAKQELLNYGQLITLQDFEKNFDTIFNKPNQLYLDI